MTTLNIFVYGTLRPGYRNRKMPVDAIIDQHSPMGRDTWGPHRYVVTLTHKRLPVRVVETHPELPVAKFCARQRKLLDAPIWTPEELDELEGKLRQNVITRQIAARRMSDRMATLAIGGAYKLPRERFHLRSNECHPCNSSAQSATESEGRCRDC